MPNDNAAEAADERHPIERVVADNKKDGYDQAHVDLSEFVPDAVPLTSDLLGVKGPDDEQWSAEARTARGAIGGEGDPTADLPRGDG